MYVAPNKVAVTAPEPSVDDATVIGVALLAPLALFTDFNRLLKLLVLAVTALVFDSLVILAAISAETVSVVLLYSVIKAPAVFILAGKASYLVCTDSYDACAELFCCSITVLAELAAETCTAYSEAVSLYCDNTSAFVS